LALAVATGGYLCLASYRHFRPDRQTGSADWKNRLDPPLVGAGQSLLAGNVHVSV